MSTINLSNDRCQESVTGYLIILDLNCDGMFNNTRITQALRNLMESVHYRPAVSIIMPFEPKMSLAADLHIAILKAVEKVEKQLAENFPDEMSDIVRQRLKVIIKSLNFHTHKKSIAIFVSPVFEKVLYLDMAVVEKIKVDQTFELRELLYSKQQLPEYLVLLVSNHESRMYLGDGDSLVRLVSNSSDPLSDEVVLLTAITPHFRHQPENEDCHLENFLHHVDHTLDILLKCYHLPLFILGTEKQVTQFKKLTGHKGAIIEYVTGDVEMAGIPQIRDMLRPHIADWDKVIQVDLLNQLQEAADRKKLSVGMYNVWKEAQNNKSRLLVVEKGFKYTGLPVVEDAYLYPGKEHYPKFSYIKDEVDEVIEKVLENGGDVALVDSDLPATYQHIALIPY